MNKNNEIGPEIKRVTLHPLKDDGTIDPEINIYPKTLLDGIVDRTGYPVEVVTTADVDSRIDEVEDHIEEVEEQTNEQLAQKQDILVSGETIKTINGEGLLGSGNIEVQGGGSAEKSTRNIPVTFSAHNLLADDKGKAPTLNKIVFTNETDKTLYLVTNIKMADKEYLNDEFHRYPISAKNKHADGFMPNRTNLEAQPKVWSDAIAIEPGEEVPLWKLLGFDQYIADYFNTGLSEDSPIVDYASYCRQMYEDWDVEYSYREGARALHEIAKQINYCSKNGFCIPIDLRAKKYREYWYNMCEEDGKLIKRCWGPRSSISVHLDVLNGLFRSHNNNKKIYIVERGEHISIDEEGEEIITPYAKKVHLCMQAHFDVLGTRYWKDRIDEETSKQWTDFRSQYFIAVSFRPLYAPTFKNRKKEVDIEDKEY